MNNKIIDKYTEKIATAIKNKNVEERETFKLIKAKLMEFVTQKNVPELNEASEIQILNKMLKELKEEKENYIKVNNSFMTDEINKQINIVDSLLPAAATKDDIKNIIDDYIKEFGAITQKEMGILMKHIKSKLTNVDGKLASETIREYF